MLHLPKIGEAVESADGRVWIVVDHDGDTAIGQEPGSSDGMVLVPYDGGWSAVESLGTYTPSGPRATIGAGAYIEAGAEAHVGARAYIEARARIEAGDSLHWHSGSYRCDAYRRADGTPVLRHGCVTLPLADWTPGRQAELCAVHDADAADTLARAVRTARAFFGEAE